MMAIVSVGVDVPCYRKVFLFTIRLVAVMLSEALLSGVDIALT